MNPSDKKRISVEDVSKSFRIGYRGERGALAKLVSLFTGKEEKKRQEVLRGVSFEARAGEIVGIIGKNGSGKSTLLRIIAGIYKQDSGTIATEGKLLYLSGFGQGLKPKLTMEENIYLIGSIMGLRRRDIRERFDEIVRFSGLAEYVHTKIYQFSTGMVTRLNFSIGIHCLEYHKPDILLIDEVLEAGGDVDFQKQAGDKMEEFIRGGATVILVSHNLADIRKYCSRLVLLERGKVASEGNVPDIIARYLA